MLLEHESALREQGDQRGLAHHGPGCDVLDGWADASYGDECFDLESGCKCKS